MQKYRFCNQFYKMCTLNYRDKHNTQEYLDYLNELSTLDSLPCSIETLSKYIQIHNKWEGILFELYDSNFIKKQR